MLSILDYGGLPLTAERVVSGVVGIAAIANGNLASAVTKLELV
jgi:hypothetical protein